MENQPVTEGQATPDNSVQETLGVIRIIEHLFHAMNRASFKLSDHDAVYAGMRFLNEFHTQLLSKVPPAVLEAERAKNNPAAAQEAKQGEPSPANQEATNEPANA